MKKALIALIAILFAGILVYLAFPGLVARGLLKGGRVMAGLETHRISANGLEFAYLEGGSGPAMLLLHGFGADKDNWLLLAPYLTERFRLVIPDLPGFGQSSAPADQRFDVSAQAERVAAFMRALEISPAHVAGSSMGGQIAAVLAARHPDMVRTLALISPLGAEQTAGVPPSAAMLRLAGGENVLLPADRQAFAGMLALMFSDPPWVPGALTRYYASEWARKRPLLARVFDDITGPGYVALPALAAEIRAPTLVLWGDRDQILPAAGASVIAGALQDASLSLLPGCGHLPMIEQPRATALAYRGFLDRSSSR